MRRIAIHERAHWQAQAEEQGFLFHHMYGEPYWDESAYYAFTLRQIEQDIEDVSAELHQMCLSVVDEAVGSEVLLRRLAIPEMYWEYVAASWRRRDASLYGRFDLVYDGCGPAKLYEYNADTPTAVYETAFFQWMWFEEQASGQRLPAGADQFNSLYERLVGRFQAMFGAGDFVHFASCGDSVEDRQTVLFFADLAAQAGIEPKLAEIEEIGLDLNGRLVDADNYIIFALFKLYPWEQMFRDRYGPALLGCDTRFVEPPWKAILSNKGLLPLLWQRFPGHPNLLPAYFDDDPKAASLGATFIRKPLFSREGWNVELWQDGQRSEASDGGYGAEGWIRQAWQPLPGFGARYPVIGSWIVGDEPAGLCIREDNAPVTRNLSRFLPHAIVG